MSSMVVGGGEHCIVLFVFQMLAMFCNAATILSIRDAIIVGVGARLLRCGVS